MGQHPSEKHTSPSGPGVALLVMAVAVGVSLLLAELAVRIWSADEGVYDIEMWRYALEVKEADPDPERVFHHRAGATTSLYGAAISTNNQGFRAEADVAPEPAPGVSRLMLLGDSITFGWGVAPEHTFATRLPELLRPRVVEVVNTGVGNYGTVQQVATLINQGLSLNPHAVVLCYFINDAEPLPRWTPRRWWNHSRLMVLLWSRLDRLERMAGADQDWKAYYQSLYQDDAAGWQATRRAIQKLGAVSRERHLPAAVVIFPELHDLSPDYPFRAEQAKVAQLAQGEGLPVLDLTDDFLGKEPRALWVSDEDAHPNAEGHRILAEGITRALSTLSW